MSWQSWIPRIAGYGLAPFTGGASIAIGEGIAQGINSSQAVKKAEGQQQQATNTAMRTGGDVYTQQRADAQNLFGQPYQTLGGLLGMNIAPIGPPTGQVPTTANPTGYPQGLVTNSPPQVRYDLPADSPITPALTPYRGATLAQLSQLSSGGPKAKSASSYGHPAKARA